MKTTRIFHLKVFIFGGKILNIFEWARFRNVLCRCGLNFNSEIHADGTNICFFFYHNGCQEMVGIPKNFLKPHSNLLLTVPRRLFHCGTFVKYSVVFHLQMFFFYNYVK